MFQSLFDVQRWFGFDKVVAITAVRFLFSDYSLTVQALSRDRQRGSGLSHHKQKGPPVDQMAVPATYSPPISLRIHRNPPIGTLPNSFKRGKTESKNGTHRSDGKKPAAPKTVTGDYVQMPLPLLPADSKQYHMRLAYAMSGPLR